MRLLALLLAVILLIGTVPVTVFAKDAGAPASTEAVASKKCTVIAHGGIIENEKSPIPFDGTAARGTAVRITLDKTAFAGHSFVCWKGDDGTEIPQKSFRLLVERNCAFYPVFSDLVGDFGDWQALLRGELCTDGVLYVREDSAKNLKEYKWQEDWHSFDVPPEQLDSDRHTETCSKCGYTAIRAHWFDSGVITTEPTHSTAGVKTITCRECGYKKTEPVPAATASTSHEYGEWEIITEAKDGQPGRRRHTCACGASEEEYYIKAEWEKYYKGRNVEMKTVDGKFGYYQNEWHYSFTDKAGNDVYIYMLRRVPGDTADQARYGFMFVDDRTDSLKPVYVMKSRAKNGQSYTYSGYDWSQFEYARNFDEYIEKIDSMVLYGGGRTVKYSSQAVDAFKAWETLYNESAKNDPEWYINAGYTRTECEYLGYDCWEYRKVNDIPNYNDTVYRVVKSDNTCLYAREGASLAGYEVTAIKDMYYEDTLPTFDSEDTLAKYNWRKTHCVVNEIGTADEQLSRTEMEFSTTPPQREYTAGFRFYVDHYPLPQGSSATYHFGANGGEDDQSFNFDIIPRFHYISGRDYMNEDDYAVTLVERTNEKYNFDHWEKYDWETDTWSVYDGPLKFNYVVPERDGNNKMIFNEDGSAVLLEDHRLTDIMYFRGIYKLKTFHIKVEGGKFIFNGERVCEADVPYGTKISLTDYSNMVPEGQRFECFKDSSGNSLYYSDYSSITVTKDMTYSAHYVPDAGTTTEYVGIQAQNGRVLMDKEEFYGGSYEVGTELTLTTEGNEDYPYFLGWYISDGKSENSDLLSKETTLHYTVTEYAELIARWSKTEVEKKHNITAVNGFVRSGYEKLAVSAVSVGDNRDIQVIKDPTNPLKIKQWVLTGTFEDGTECTEFQDYSEYSSFYLYEYANDGKGYPWNITITGEADICAEHDWDEGVVTKEPTYTEYGEMTYTCKVCGTQKTESIAMLPRYCVHACSECGKCTLDATDVSCTFERCTCGGNALPTQNTAIDFIHNNGTGSITPHVYTVVELQPDNPYVQYVLKAAEGYDVEEIYDISFTDASGNKYTPTAGETVTVILTVGIANAQALHDGRMFIIHITDSGNIIYGLGHEQLTANVDAGTVTFTVDSFSPFVLARSAVEYYGRSALADMSNSTALLYAYDMIVDGVGTSKDRISVYNGTNAITQDEIKTVLDAYRRDHTEHFWLGNGYSVNYTEATVTEIVPTYIMSGIALETAKTKFNESVAELLSGITSSMSEYEREKTLHDRLAAKASYESADNAHNAYGAIVEGKAVCEGYAEAYQYLLQLAGLQSFIITGTSTNPSTGMPEGHAWNIVKVDGKFYHVDLTWDDQGERLFYAYFNKTDSRISEDHSITATSYALPVCNSETADYFTVNGGKTDSFNAQAVGTMLKNGNGTARVYVTGDKAAFIEAFQANIRTVAQYAEISNGFTYGYANLGREYILTIAKAGVTVSGTATSFGDDTDKVTIQLIKVGTAEVAYETTVKGNSISYSIAGVEADTYTMKVMKQNHVTREYAVTVGTENLKQDVEIWLFGDVTGDGNVNIKDWGRMRSHINGTSLLDGYAFACADVTQDGNVNIKDWGRMRSHINGTNPLW